MFRRVFRIKPRRLGKRQTQAPFFAQKGTHPGQNLGSDAFRFLYNTG